MIQVNYNGDMISQFYLELNFEKHGCRREIHGCRAIITLNFLGFQISLLPKDKQVKLFHKKKKKVNNLLFSLPFTLLLSVFLFIFYFGGGGGGGYYNFWFYFFNKGQISIRQEKRKEKKDGPVQDIRVKLDQ